jgi:hypothetical protein
MFYFSLTQKMAFTFITSLLLVGCNESIMDSKYIKSLQPLIDTRYQVFGEASLLAKIDGDALEDKSLEC